MLKTSEKSFHIFIKSFSALSRNTEPTYVVVVVVVVKKGKKLKIGFEMRMCGLPGLWR
jgi:hypothetical protein